MSHLVESMAYVERSAADRPWWEGMAGTDGLGVSLEPGTSVLAAMQAAKLDWMVRTMPLRTENPRREEPGQAPWLEVPGHSALVRSTDSSVFDVVGSRFQPVQNGDILRMFYQFCEATGSTIETVGALDGGRDVWSLARMPDGGQFELPGGDESLAYLLLHNPHRLGRSIRVQFTSVRVVCWNTLTFALTAGNEVYRQSHASRASGWRSSGTQEDYSRTCKIRRDMVRYQLTAHRSRGSM